MDFDISSDTITPLLLPYLTIGGTSGVVMPAGTTAQRPTATAGLLRYNTSLGVPEYYNGTTWVTYSGSGTGGNILQTIAGTIPAVNTTAIYPLDNTIPTNAEGVQLFTTSFTPLSTSSKISLSYTISINTNTNNTSVATFAFSGTTNLGGSVTRCATSTGTQGVLYNLTNQVVWSPGSTATITISGRCGAMASSTTYVNFHPTAFFGGTLVSSYIITEFI